MQNFHRPIQLKHSLSSGTHDLTDFEDELEEVSEPVFEL